MNSEQITAFLQEHWSWVTLIIGAVLLIGAIMNWNWLCDPTGKPDSHRYGRGSRRVILPMRADERKRAEHLPTLLIQQIRLQWYKTVGVETTLCKGTSIPEQCVCRRQGSIFCHRWQRPKHDCPVCA